MGSYQGRDAFKAFAAANASGVWEDMHLEIHQLIAHDDQVIARFTNSGVNLGPLHEQPGDRQARPMDNNAGYADLASVEDTTTARPGRRPAGLDVTECTGAEDDLGERRSWSRSATNPHRVRCARGGQTCSR
jgi:hypothetical protein